MADQTTNLESNDPEILPHDISTRWEDILGNRYGGGDYGRALVVSALWKALLTGRPDLAALVVRAEPLQLTTAVREELAREIAPWICKEQIP